MNVRHQCQGPSAVEEFGVHECERATMLNQVWLLVEPDFQVPLKDGSRDHTLYIVCGLCGGFRTEPATSSLQPGDCDRKEKEMISVIPQQELPARLADLRDPPKQLYVRGDNDALASPAVAIVGSRACSSYGKSIARKWAYELASRGVVIVSGLARGIDGEAHLGALEAPSGRTVAVLGCGIDRDYPSAHSELAKRIETTGGAVISEYEPGIEPAPWRFPARNRIIAGLADVTLVIEARERSGSLITAEFAIEMEKPVLVVPGDISERTGGSNQLLRERRAHAVLSPGDVLGWLESLHVLSEYTDQEGA